MEISLNEVVLGCLIGVPIIFAVGRYSGRVAWFRAKNEKKYTVQEFMKARQ